MKGPGSVRKPSRQERQRRAGKQRTIACRRPGSQKIIARARAGEARIESLTSETQRTQPPLLYDLTELQRHANRLFGFSAQKTLDLAQALYEQHKLISYPRTDSRHLSTDVAATIPRIVAVISRPYQEQLAAGNGRAALGQALCRRQQGERPPRHYSHRGLAAAKARSPKTNARSTT